MILFLNGNKRGNKSVANPLKIPHRVLLMILLRVLISEFMNELGGHIGFFASCRCFSNALVYITFIMPPLCLPTDRPNQPIGIDITIEIPILILCTQRCYTVKVKALSFRHPSIVRAPRLPGFHFASSTPQPSPPPANPYKMKI